MSDERQENLRKERELVIKRLETISPELHFSSGATFQNLSRDEIISEIQKDTTVGQEFVRTEMEFLRAFKDGKLLSSLIADRG